MNVKQNAPCRRGSTASAASHVESVKVASSEVTSHVSFVESIVSLLATLACASRSRSQASSSGVLVRLPLCASASPPLGVAR